MAEYGLRYDHQLESVKYAVGMVEASGLASLIQSGDPVFVVFSKALGWARSYIWDGNAMALIVSCFHHHHIYSTAARPYEI